MTTAASSAGANNYSPLLLALNMLNVGYVRLQALMKQFGSVEKIFGANEAQLKSVEGIGPVLARKIVAASEKVNITKELELIEKRNVKVITIFDGAYPKNLKEIYDPPIVLYVKGEILAEDEAAVAIVGCRRATYYGSSTAERLGFELASRGVTVASGMARGVDTAAHRGCLKAKGRTLAVLGSGLARVYPPENEELAGDISRSGAVISEFSMEEPPHKSNFPARNRTISGLSLGVVVVEAPAVSGALITARMAMEQNREVFAVPGEAKKLSAQGTNQLIRDGAKLVESADDVLSELKPRLSQFLRENRNCNCADVEADNGVTDNGVRPLFKKGSDPIQRRFSDEESRVLTALSDEPLHIDEVVVAGGLPINAASSLLLKLVLSGVVKELPGRYFVIS